MRKLAVSELSARDLVWSLGSPTCPACGKPKGLGKTFCSQDYFRLSNEQRKALYRRVGQGFAAACSTLGISETIIPDLPKRT